MDIDYNRQMKEVLNGQKRKERLLMHACCAVCAGGVLAREFLLEGKKRKLTDFFDIVLYYDNPNIDTNKEFCTRGAALNRLSREFDIRRITTVPYYALAVKSFWGEVSKTAGIEQSALEAAPEGGARCKACMKVRLERAAKYANLSEFDRFCTTLTASPHKDADYINRVGIELGEQFKVSFLPADFKKEGGVIAANELVKRINLYRQNYCGCEYSKE